VLVSVAMLVNDVVVAVGVFENWVVEVIVDVKGVVDSVDGCSVGASTGLAAVVTSLTVTISSVVSNNVYRIIHGQ
jgi:hypothetical protein